MRFRPLFLYLVISSLLLGSRLPYSNTWELRKAENEMWVYTRDRTGSEIKEVKLVMHVDASIKDIADVLNDASLQTNWVYRCTEAHSLGGEITTGWYYYSRISMPWPMEDRDVVAKVVGKQTASKYYSQTSSAPDKKSLVPGCVRITDFDVKSIYERLPSGKTKMTYTMHSEPGGYVPSWLVNMFVDKGPIETLTKLRDLVEKN